MSKKNKSGLSNQKLAAAGVALLLVGLALGSILNKNKTFLSGRVSGCQAMADQIFPGQVTCLIKDGALIGEGGGIRINLDTHKYVD